MSLSRLLCPPGHGALEEPCAVSCMIAEPTALSALHVACARANFGCKTRFWCGFYETALPGKPGACSKSIDVGFEDDLYFMLNKSFGVAHTWLRRWRYRMYLHRASFQGEAVLLRLAAPGWKRSEEGQATVSPGLGPGDPVAACARM